MKRKNIYASGSPRTEGKTFTSSGDSLYQVLKELRKTIKDTLDGRRSADWFNRDYPTIGDNRRYFKDML